MIRIRIELDKMEKESHGWVTTRVGLETKGLEMEWIRNVLEQNITEILFK